MGHVGCNVHIIEPAQDGSPPRLLSPRIISVGPEFVCVMLSKMRHGGIQPEPVFLKITEIYVGAEEASKEVGELRKEWKKERDKLNEWRREAERENRR